MVMTADYEGLATELLQVNGALLQLPALHLQVRLNQGEPFVLNYLLLHHQAHPVELSQPGGGELRPDCRPLRPVGGQRLHHPGAGPLNNRQVIVTLSPKGLEVIQSFRAQVLRSTAQMLSLLGPEDAKEFIRLRRKLLDNLTQQ